MLALVIVRKNRDVKIRFCMEIGVEKFRYCLRVGTFFVIEAKAQGDYADRKGTVQNGEKKQFVG